MTGTEFVGESGRFFAVSGEGFPPVSTWLSILGARFSIETSRVSALKWCQCLGIFRDR